MVKILPQHTEIEHNRARLIVQNSALLNKIVRVLGVGNDPKSGKTVNIHGKICRERPVGND